MFARTRQAQHIKGLDPERTGPPEAYNRHSVLPQGIPEAAPHNCLAVHTTLRRKSNGLPSATATYTAFRKAAAGGGLLPDYHHQLPHQMPGQQVGKKQVVFLPACQYMLASFVC